jgi:uncharacterized membrane protein YdbT with pleckstrin-like domain
VPFPRKLLNDHEDVILDLRPHWWYFAKPAAVLAAFLIVSVALQVAVGNSVVTLVTLVPVVVALLWVAGRYARWANTNFVVTTERLIFRSGVLAKHGREIPIERVNDISFHQSIFERIIGTGDLTIESAGERGQETFSNVRRPSLVQNEIYRQMEAAQDRTASRLAGGHNLSIPEQIEKLDELRQRGVISQAEFDAKKAKLLDQL